MVINKALNGTTPILLSITNFSSAGTAQVWQLTSANTISRLADVNYASGTLSYTFNASHAPEIGVSFTNIAASAGQTLSLRTDGSGGSQIALTRLTYATAAVAPVSLSIIKSGGDVILSWPAGTLQEATSINGTYNDLTGVSSPYTNAITGGQKYYRVKVQ